MAKKMSRSRRGATRVVPGVVALAATIVVVLVAVAVAVAVAVLAAATTSTTMPPTTTTTTPNTTTTTTTTPRIIGYMKLGRFVPATHNLVKFACGRVETDRGMITYGSPEEDVRQRALVAEAKVICEGGVRGVMARRPRVEKFVGSADAAEALRFHRHGMKQPVVVVSKTFRLRDVNGRRLVNAVMGAPSMDVPPGYVMYVAEVMDQRGVVGLVVDAFVKLGPNDEEVPCAEIEVETHVLERRRVPFQPLPSDAVRVFVTGPYGHGSCVPQGMEQWKRRRRLPVRHDVVKAIVDDLIERYKSGVAGARVAHYDEEGNAVMSKTFKAETLANVHSTSEENTPDVHKAEASGWAEKPAATNFHDDIEGYLAYSNNLQNYAFADFVKRSAKDVTDLKAAVEGELDRRKINAKDTNERTVIASIRQNLEVKVGSASKTGSGNNVLERNQAFAKDSKIVSTYTLHTFNTGTTPEWLFSWANGKFETLALGLERGINLGTKNLPGGKNHHLTQNGHALPLPDDLQTDGFNPDDSGGGGGGAMIDASSVYVTFSVMKSQAEPATAASSAAAGTSGSGQKSPTSSRGGGTAVVEAASKRQRS